MTTMNVLPPKKDLLAACRGEVEHDHPLLRAASALTRLHEERLSATRDRTDEIDTRRKELIHEADNWIDTRITPAHGTARIHTETIGSVLDRLAQFTAHAYATLTATTPYWDLCDAWESVAELACAYEDLITEVTRGQRRLPGYR